MRYNEILSIGIFVIYLYCFVEITTISISILLLLLLYNVVLLSKGTSNNYTNLYLSILITLESAFQIVWILLLWQH